MKKSKRIVKEFINFLYREYDVPKIPIHVHWYAKSIVVGDHPCFGVCITYDNEPEKNEIHAVAGTKYGTGSALRIISHEFVHYLQYLNGKFEKENTEEVEDIAEENGQALVCKFIQNHKKTGGIVVDGVIKAWEKYGCADGERKDGEHDV